MISGADLAELPQVRAEDPGAAAIPDVRAPAGGRPLLFSPDGDVPAVLDRHSKGER